MMSGLLQHSSMQHALSNAGRAMLADHLRRAPVLAFDFDGTLSPLIADPAAAALPAKTSELLFRLTRRTACIVLSGRARADVLARLQGIPFAEILGNYGSEPGMDIAPLRAEVQRWLLVLETRLRSPRGIAFEDKGCSLAVHYRRTQAPAQALRSILQAVGALGVGRVVHGKYVVNLIPAQAPDKGTGLRRAMEALKRSRALYVGDDESDEDIFKLPAQAGVLGVRVGYRNNSQAPLYLYGQHQTDDLLSWLLASCP